MTTRYLDGDVRSPLRISAGERVQVTGCASGSITVHGGGFLEVSGQVVGDLVIEAGGGADIFGRLAAPVWVAAGAELGLAGRCEQLITMRPGSIVSCQAGTRFRIGDHTLLLDATGHLVPPPPSYWTYDAAPWLRMTSWLIFQTPVA